MRRISGHVVVWLCAIALGVAGVNCAKTSKKGNNTGNGTIGDGTTVNTVVSATSIILGESFKVTCEVRNKAGDLIEVETEFSVSPESTVIGADVTPRGFGSHKATCKIKGYDIVDETPAEVMVNAASLDTVLDKSTIKSGEVATVTCVAKDKDGQVVKDVVTEVKVSPETGVEVSDHELTGKKAGNYLVGCRLPATGQGDDTPASLTVTAGDPAKVITELDPATIKAGDSSTLGCRVEDAEGNEVTGVTTTADVPTDVTRTGNKLTGTKAGAYPIICKIEGSTTPLEQQPATLTITAGDPVKVVLKANPDKTNFKTTESVTLVYTVYDQYDNEVTGIGGTISGPTVGVTNNGNDNYTFNDEGTYDFTVTLAAPYAHVTDTLTLYCDNEPPQLVITYPERGATIDGEPKVVVKGKVTDSGSGVDSLTINGDPVTTINQDGTFEHPTTPVIGLNFVEAIAKDKSGQSVRRTVAYYYSGAFEPYSQDESKTPPMKDGMVIRLSQDVLDDFDHPCSFDVNDKYTCTKIDDFATIGEVLLNNLDFGALLGGTKLFETSINVYDNSFSWSSGWVDLYVGLVYLAATVNVKGSFDIDVKITDLQVNRVGLNLSARTGGIDAKISVDKDSQNNPGFYLETQTTLQFNGAARFTKLDVIDGDGNNVRSAVCTAIDVYEAITGDTVVWQPTICPSNGVFAPLATLNPSVKLDSNGSITKMTLDTGFNVSVDSNGKVIVKLVKGTVSFGGQKIQITIAQGLKLNLGSVSILGGLVTLPLGTIDLQPFANAIQSAVDALVNNFILGTLQGLIEAGINAVLSTDVLNLSGILSDAFNALAINQPIQLPKFVPGQLEAPLINIASKLSSISFEKWIGNDLKTGGMTVGLSTLFHSQKKTDRNPLGSFLRNKCGLEQDETLVFTKEQPFELAAHVDALNQAFYAIWWNGGLDLPIKGSDLGNLDGIGAGPIDLSKMEIQLKFLLPPILNNCAQKGLLEMQIGDLYVDAKLQLGTQPLTFTGYVSFSAAVKVVVDNGTFGIEVLSSPEPFMGLELVTVNGNPGTSGLLENLLTSLIKDTLIGQFAGNALGGFPLPEIDLGALTGLPGAAKLKILPADVQDQFGYYILRGDIDGQ